MSILKSEVEAFVGDKCVIWAGSDWQAYLERQCLASVVGIVKGLAMVALQEK
jgi:hypothetical protein